MLLSDIAERLELLAKHPLKSIRRAPGGVVAELGTVLPDGQIARIAVSFADADLESAVDAGVIIHRHAAEADAALDRYIASFQPATWDDQVWSD
jgi:hypothetical protein